MKLMHEAKLEELRDWTENPGFSGWSVEGQRKMITELLDHIEALNNLVDDLRDALVEADQD